MNKSKIALCLIVKGADSEAEALARCLNNIAPFVDGIFVTVTQINERVVKTAEAYRANVSYFEWCNDFGKARNYNFAQVPKDFTHILWLDADDQIRGIERLREVIEENPDVDAFSLYYLYAFDEWKNPIVVHLKTQVVKNDGCVEWVGALHEDFKEKREVKRFLIKGIDRLHLTDDSRINTAKERNLEISKEELSRNSKDPRCYWNVGNSLKAMGRDEEALKIFDEFLKTSQSDEEKYIVRLRRSESLWHLGRKPEAIDEARYAIGTRPNYPDAYNLLGSLYLETKQFIRAVEMYKIALQLKPPYYSIIVYNPRDYDYVPFMNLAKAYFNLSLPTLALECLRACVRIYPEDNNLKELVVKMEKEAEIFDRAINRINELKALTDKSKLKEELDNLPPDLQQHPGVCNLRNINFIKEESSGKDLVIYCGYTEEVWSPETARIKGIGGSEEAVIWLSRLWKEAGWNVTVYNNCGHKELEFDGVKYKPFWAWNYRDKQDVVILWRHPKMAEYEINCDKIYLDLHDVLPADELNEKRLSKLTRIFVKSKFHRSLFPNVPDEKFIIVPNGIDAKLFEQDAKHDPYLLINTSSPERSLTALISGFEYLKKEYPQLKCKWAYGWGVFDTAHAENAEIMEWKNKTINKMKEVGIEEMGRISHGEVAKLYLTSGIFAFPSEFAEIDCISLTKAMASGCVPVTTDFAAMGEKTGHGGEFISSKKTKDSWCKPYQYDFSINDPLELMDWINSVKKILDNPPDKEQIDNMRKWARDNYDWNRISKVWLDIFKTL